MKKGAGSCEERLQKFATDFASGIYDDEEWESVWLSFLGVVIDASEHASSWSDAQRILDFVWRLSNAEFFAHGVAAHLFDVVYLVFDWYGQVVFIERSVDSLNQILERLLQAASPKEVVTVCLERLELELIDPSWQTSSQEKRVRFDVSVETRRHAILHLRLTLVRELGVAMEKISSSVSHSFLRQAIQCLSRSFSDFLDGEDTSGEDDEDEGEGEGEKDCSAETKVKILNEGTKPRRMSSNVRDVVDTFDRFSKNMMNIANRIRRDVLSDLGFSTQNQVSILYIQYFGFALLGWTARSRYFFVNENDIAPVAKSLLFMLSACRLDERELLERPHDVAEARKSQSRRSLKDLPDPDEAAVSRVGDGQQPGGVADDEDAVLEFDTLGVALYDWFVRYGHSLLLPSDQLPISKLFASPLSSSTHLRLLVPYLLDWLSCTDVSLHSKGLEFLDMLLLRVLSESAEIFAVNEDQYVHIQGLFENLMAIMVYSSKDGSRSLAQQTFLHGLESLTPPLRPRVLLHLLEKNSLASLDSYLLYELKKMIDGVVQIARANGNVPSDCSEYLSASIFRVLHKKLENHANDAHQVPELISSLLNMLRYLLLVSDNDIFSNAWSIRSTHSLNRLRKTVVRVQETLRRASGKRENEVGKDPVDTPPLPVSASREDQLADRRDLSYWWCVLEICDIVLELMDSIERPHEASSVSTSQVVEASSSSSFSVSSSSSSVEILNDMESSSSSISSAPAQSLSEKESDD